MSEKLTIKTDNKWKNFLYGYELTAKEKKEFDYMSEEEIDCGNFSVIAGMFILWMIFWSVCRKN